MLRLLYIEDSPADYRLLVRHLSQHGMAAEVTRVDEREALCAALAQPGWDAVLADYNVPRLVFAETLHTVRQALPDVPVVLVSGSVGEENAVELLKQGVTDFVLKDNLVRLCPAIERGIRDGLQRRARQAAERALQESEARFQVIAASMGEAIWMADVDLRTVHYVSPAFATIWGRSSASVYNDPAVLVDAIHPDDREGVTAAMHAAKSANRTFEHVYRVLHPDGALRWVRDRGFPVPESAGMEKCYVDVVEDVTVRRQADERLRQAARVFDSTRDGVFITALDGSILAVNKAFTDITGYAEGEALGRDPSLLRSDRHGPEFFQALWASLEQAGQWQGEIWNRRKSGEVYPAWMNVTTVHDERDRPMQYAVVFSDISQVRSSEEKLARLAHYDPLTHLPNRLLLQSRLEHVLERARRYGHRVAVLSIDLDRFKTVNDSLGHVVGDRLLVDVAQRLRQRVRSEDTLGRFAGDEFLLLLEQIGSPEEAAGVARDLLQTLTPSFQLAAGQEHYLSASVGISIFPDDGDSAQDLLRDADAATHQAKERGRNRFCFYTADMNANAFSQLELEAALRRGLERDEFQLHFQPKVDLRTGLISGAEALIRWQREGGTLEPPGRFIPLAEKSGLIVLIGAWTIDAACRQLREWHDAGWTELHVSVNVSARQFYSGDLPITVSQSLARHQVPAGALELEVTESMLMEDPEQTVGILRVLKRLGVRLSLDDFGTGYSSFAYLSRFPIDALKIDQSFVRRIVIEPDAAMIAVSVIDLAHRMHLKVVAEGVETEPQLAYLRSRGCDEMQGYYFARPMPAVDFATLMRQGHRLPAAEGAGHTAERTLLVVDDEQGVIEVLRRLLSREGYRILVARSGVEGLEMLALHRVQVILSDQRMPLMTGTDFLARVKELHPDTVRIVLSGYTELESITAAVNVGAIYKFIGKPWNDDLLREHIRDAFQYHEAVIQPRSRRAGGVP